VKSPNIDNALASRHASETGSGARFRFGENWRDFLRTVDETRIDVAMESLKRMLGVQTLEDRRFVDIGSGSGLFSLAAHRLGADVASFDYDPSSVGCTRELRDRYARDSVNWRVLHGSALDKQFLEKLGTFDVVYSWGVLHHTGNMWQAIYNVLPMVRSGGILFLALYNDQGVWSKRWARIKQVYCSGTLGKFAVSSLFLPYWTLRSATSDMIRLRAPWHTLATYKQSRGMSMWHDWHDWLGGFPFETAKPEAIIFPIKREGFVLTNLNTQYGSVGCVEYVFKRNG
jgi:2-polyprenyl-6-hydroxyphenyl methylase/3-demethylubiquinone-9 3-methyltransferase